MKQLIKRRNVINKPKLKMCEVCKKEISLYGFSCHIKFAHKMNSDDYINKYGEFRIQKKIFLEKRNIQQIKCGVCNKTFSAVGMFTHLRDTHSISVDRYVEKYGEYRPSKTRELSYKKRLVDCENKQLCLICNEEFASGQLLGGHIKREHLITKKEYIINNVFKGVHPVCKCGCGKSVKLLNYYPYKVDFRSGHNSIGENNGMFGKHFSSESKMKMSKKAIIRINTQVGIKTDTKPELEFKSILDGLNIQYIHPYDINLGDRMASIDFYLPEKDLLVEIDGEYWHPEKLENLNFHRIPNVISDKQREYIKNLVHIRENSIDDFRKESSTKELAFEYLINFSNVYNTDIKYKQKIINKEYFKLCLDKKGKKYLQSYVWLLLKFIRTFQPILPKIELEENLQDIIAKIGKYDLSAIYNESKKEFSNKGSTLGHNYLKYHFNSYWKSRFNKNKSSYDAWLDDKIMSDVIKYRIGCNDSDEVFDFSLHQLIRGLSARRITVSFFKPILAAAIYKHYLANTTSPIVLDPCCGFGARLLAFKSLYPNGTYIGCEPNIETYNELINLKKNSNWSNVELYNCKFEDFVDKQPKYDLIFTSIPYYDLEVYSNNTEYKSFTEWKSTFIKSIEQYSGKNCYINCSIELVDKLKWTNIDSYIVSNTTHFNNTDDESKEVIVKI